MPSTDPDDRGWATPSRDTRERTCHAGGSAPFAVWHDFRLSRAGGPGRETVVRAHEAGVEWTARANPESWLRTVAETATPYRADRFGDVDGDEGDVTADARFRATSADATVDPPADLGFGDAYHYWNSPLDRVLADDHVPTHLRSLTLDLGDLAPKGTGVTATWRGDATATGRPDELPRPRDDYARVGLAVSARERVSRPAGGEGDGDRQGEWRRDAAPDLPALGSLEPAVTATLAPGVERNVPDVRGRLEAVTARLRAVASAVRWRGGTADPYAIPEEAVDVATRPLRWDG